MAFTKGHSGNPSGRPKGAAGLAKYIAEQTDDGRELIDRLLELSRNPKAPVREAQNAVFALLDRMAGKPLAPSEISVAVEGRVAYPAGWQSMTFTERVQHLLAGHGGSDGE